MNAEFGVDLASQVIAQLEISAKYSGYIEKQVHEVERTEALETMPIPPDFDYAGVPALSFEARHKLSSVHPATLGAAARISGITPAAISLLLIHLKKRRGPVRAVDIAA